MRQVTKSRPLALSPASGRVLIGVCFGLITITWLVFGQTLGHQFINYDDPDYVYQNSAVKNGLTMHGIVAAFTRSYSNNWHPLTMLSHMLDCQVFGLAAGGHHFTNVLLHTLAVLLLFLLLRQMTGALWPSAFVAAVFAIHPLHVESVAWVAERKDVLSAVFFMLTLGAYLRYVRKPSLGRYGLVLSLFAMGLMCKPMLVTLPFLLLLLDYWPLNRFAQPPSDKSKTTLRRLIVEKIPLFVLSLISSMVTLIAQQRAMRSLEDLSFIWRLQNAIASCCIYIWQMAWPGRLAVIYPYAENGTWSAWAILLGATFLVVITIATIALRRRRPYLMTGWLWYLVMLVPVLGLVQVGIQAHADRYTYLPHIGLYVASTWAIADFSASQRYLSQLARFGAVVVLVALSWCAWVQVSYWRDSESLWRHTLSVTSNNDTADNNLGNVLLHQGRADEAIVHYETVLARRSDHRETELKETYYNLGNALLQKARLDEAIAYYRKSLEFRANYTTDAHNNLGNALLRKGMADEAILHFRKVVELRVDGSKDDRARASYNLGNALLQNGEVDEAILCYQKTIELEPAFSDAHNNLGNALLRKGLADAAVSHLRKVLELSAGREKSDQAKAHYNLGNALLATNHSDEAIEHYRAAAALWPTYSEAHNNLASALLQKGLTDEAIYHFQKVVELRVDRGGAGLAKAHYNLANAFFDKGRFDDAITHYRKALELQPGYSDAHINLGNAFHHKGRMDKEAIAQYEEALKIDPNSALARSQLAWLLATSSEKAFRDGAKAVESAEKADQLSGGGNAIVLHALAAAYAEHGEFPKATETARRALALTTAEGNTALTNALQREITSYQAGLPYRENRE